MSCMNVKMERVGGMKVRMALICGEIETICALAEKDGKFLLTVDGKYILVKKQRQ